MADPRFFRSAGPYSLSRLAEFSGAEVAEGADGAREFTGVAPLAAAGAHDVSFLDNKRYRADFENSGAGACVVHPKLADAAPAGMALLLSENPYRAYARVARALHPTAEARGEVHPAAQVAASAEIGQGTDIAAGAVIGADAKIGERCRIGPNATIGEGVELGDACEIGAGAALSHCLIGARVTIHPGVVIGARGFGFDMSDFPYEDVPQLGRVIVEEDVEIGANSTVDRGAGPDTVIGAGSKLDNLVQIGHNVRLGRGCVLVAQVGIAGSAVLEDFVALGGQVGVGGHITLGRGAQVAATSGVLKDVPAGMRMAGTPAMRARDYYRLIALWERQAKSKGRSDE